MPKSRAARTPTPCVWEENRGGLLATTISLAVLVKWAVALGPYSGMATPPSFGDFEAQRHWMEITYNTPLCEWYVETAANNLSYWGLDYPPLTAYHSYAMGRVAHAIDPSFVALSTSQGMETPAHKTFMRWTVLFADLVVAVTALTYWVLHVQTKDATVGTTCMLLAVQLLNPALLLVDHAHFQYNCVSLGLFIWVCIFVSEERPLPACIAFTLALTYKQMELFHAPVVGVFMLALVWRRPTVTAKLAHLLGVAAVTLGTFAFIVWPFVECGRGHMLETLTQYKRRIFPEGRGLYEDKVANWWVASSPLVKWKTAFSNDVLLSYCALIVGVLILFPLVILFRHAHRRQFLLASVNVALAAFLFGYQVHEKHILLVVVPAQLLLHMGALWPVWVLNMAVISLHPLCVKDGTSVAFFALAIAFYVATTQAFGVHLWNRGTNVIYHASMLGGLVICVMHELQYPLLPMARYPDQWPVANSIFCCVNFMGLFVAGVVLQARDATQHSKRMTKWKKNV